MEENILQRDMEKNKYREELKILTFNPQTEWCCHLEEHANAQSSCLYS